MGIPFAGNLGNEEDFTCHAVAESGVIVADTCPIVAVVQACFVSMRRCLPSNTIWISNKSHRSVLQILCNTQFTWSGQLAQPSSTGFPRNICYDYEYGSCIARTKDTFSCREGCARVPRQTVFRWWDASSGVVGSNTRVGTRNRIQHLQAVALPEMDFKG